MRKVAIVALIIFGLVYFGQAQKVVKANQARLKWQLDEEKITQEQYNEQTKENTLQKMLLNPQKVLAVD